MFLCSEIYYALLETNSNTVTLEYTELGYDRAMIALAPIFDAVLDDIGNRLHARRVLYQLAAGENVYTENVHPNTAKRAIDFLISKAIIERTEKGRYAFVEPMFKQYILLTENQ